MRKSKEKAFGIFDRIVIEGGSALNGSMIDVKEPSPLDTSTDIHNNEPDEYERISQSRYEYELRHWDAEIERLQGELKRWTVLRSAQSTVPQDLLLSGLFTLPDDYTGPQMLHRSFDDLKSQRAYQNFNLRLHLHYHSKSQSILSAMTPNLRKMANDSISAQEQRELNVAYRDLLSAQRDTADARERRLWIETCIQKTLENMTIYDSRVLRDSISTLRMHAKLLDQIVRNAGGISLLDEIHDQSLRGDMHEIKLWQEVTDHLISLVYTLQSALEQTKSSQPNIRFTILDMGNADPLFKSTLWKSCKTARENLNLGANMLEEFWSYDAEQWHGTVSEGGRTEEAMVTREECLKHAKSAALNRQESATLIQRLQSSYRKASTQAINPNQNTEEVATGWNPYELFKLPEYYFPSDDGDGPSDSPSESDDEMQIDSKNDSEAFTQYPSGVPNPHWKTSDKLWCSTPVHSPEWVTADMLEFGSPPPTPTTPRLEYLINNEYETEELSREAEELSREAATSQKKRKRAKSLSDEPRLFTQMTGAADTSLDDDDSNESRPTKRMRRHVSAPPELVVSKNANIEAGSPRVTHATDESTGNAAQHQNAPIDTQPGDSGLINHVIVTEEQPAVTTIASQPDPPQSTGISVVAQQSTIPGIPVKKSRNARMTADREIAMHHLASQELLALSDKPVSSRTRAKTRGGNAVNERSVPHNVNATTSRVRKSRK